MMKQAQQMQERLQRQMADMRVDATAGGGMVSVKDRVTYCTVCSNITDVDPCTYCTNSDRDPRIICVVEQPENVSAVERTRGFRGRYHVLMGAIAPLHGTGPDDLKIKSL